MVPASLECYASSMQPMTLRIPLASALLALGTLAAFVPARTACAQNALGGGDALSRDTRHSDPRRTSNQGVLDANTRVGANGDNGTGGPSNKVDYFSRNLIVTGDVGGGRQFRGSVGYREQSDFTGQTGSDDNRFWRAYSVYSSPYMAQANYNPYQASQSFGAIMYTRSYANASARDILTNQQPLDARIAFDRFTADSGKKMKRQADIIDPANARDTSERLNWRVTQAISAASTRDERKEIQLDDTLANMGLSTYDRQRLRQDILQGRTRRDMVGESLSSTSLLPGASLAEDARIRPTLTPEYSSIYDSLRERAGNRIPEPTTDADRKARAATIERELGTDMDWLRGQLIRSGVEGQRGVNGPRGEKKAGTSSTGTTSTRTTQDNAAPGTDPNAKPGTKTIETDGSDGMGAKSGTKSGSKDGDGKGSDGKGSDGKGADGKSADGKSADGADSKPSVDDLAFILRHGRKMQSLVPEDSSAIRDMMELGATAMSRGDFFRAEERYASVLQVLPNSATALAGVTNAQLGAGLSASAALSLRKLYAMHPEMIDTHLGTDVLPPAVRMDAALGSARARLSAASAPDASADIKSDRFDFGLLIGYIGYQTDRPEVVREGLDAMRAVRPDDVMLDLLQRIWLAPAADPTRPASPSVR